MKLRLDFNERKAILTVPYLEFSPKDAESKKIILLTLSSIKGLNIVAEEKIIYTTIDLQIGGLIPEGLWNKRN